MGWNDIVKNAVKSRLSSLVEASFVLTGDVREEDFKASELNIKSIKYASHRCDVEDSPSFKGMHTMYHLYTIQAEVEGLPSVDFTTIDFSSQVGAAVNGWHWGTWEENMDVL